jgi:tetratricopeptide (TPR) repeat protein
MASPPCRGSLAETPLPRLLLELQRAGASGELCLRSGRIEKRVALCRGLPVQVESSLPRESLAALLRERGLLSAADEARVQGEVARRRGREETALLGLRLLGPRDLLLALRDAARRRLLDCFAWTEGEFVLDEGKSLPEEARSAGLDLLPLVVEGIARHWPRERALGDLQERLSLHARPAARYPEASRGLRGDASLEALLAVLEEGGTAWAAFQAGGASATAAAALWALDAAGTLSFTASAPGEEAESEDADEKEAPPEIEIRVAERSDTGAARGAQRGASASQGKAVPGAEAESVRQEVLAKHAQLAELDHYAILGLSRGAKPADVKRAYLTAAKRLHPDALSRLGLDDLKGPANEVFASITKAHGVLSDAEARAEYDAALTGGGETDANRLLQAEALYRKGEVLLRAGNFRGALEFLAPAVRLWPDDSAYRSALGWSLHKSTPPDSEAAREHLEEAVRLDPKDATHLMRLAAVLRSLGDADGSARLVRRAKQIDPAARA